jgi:hypothetical protein
VEDGGDGPGSGHSRSLGALNISFVVRKRR